ncbi:Cof-type HAD-IIB family hydrolase [Bacillus sp. NPDC077027]|uniref:Cof-type HAD-IIB family hydrolase n=1 Tax=Bacillus sp. NPDC077027 TaxID=3390548 RepID=UPI003CFE694E
MKKMIAIDLDGTLLNTKSEISENNRQAMIRAKNAGYIVTICTGRATFDVKSLLGDLDIPIIAANGGTVHTEGYHLFSRITLDQQAGKKAAEALVERKIYFEVYTDDALLSPFDGKNKLQAEFDIVTSANPNEDLTDLWKGAMTQFKQFGIKPVDDIRQIFETDEPTYKLLCYSFDMNKLKEAQDMLGKMPELSLTSSGKHIIEVLPACSGKGTALKKLAAHYGVDRTNIYAIGDSPNDLSMFEEADHRIAMGNAVDVIKEKSTYITKGNHEDGVAYFIDKLLANQLNAKKTLV